MADATNDIVVSGVRIETFGTPSDRPPIIAVHGGLHGSWAFENIGPALAEGGWHVACLNWFGHNGSAPLPRQEALSRSVSGAATEIGLTADHLGRAPVVLAHSMGGLAALAYATAHEVEALVLLAPVVPRQFAETPIDVPYDLDVMWTAPPGMEAQLFFDATPPEQARRYAGLLCAESPQAVLEATRWLVELDVSGLTAPTRLFAGDRDPLVPAAYVEALARALGAECTTFPDQGHGLMLDPVWKDATALIDRWLTENIG